MKAVLGMSLTDLSLRDICEEITDLKRDLAAIEDFEKGIITHSELVLATSFKPSQKQLIIDTIDSLRAEKQKRNEN